MNARNETSSAHGNERKRHGAVRLALLLVLAALLVFAVAPAAFAATSGPNYPYVGTSVEAPQSTDVTWTKPLSIVEGDPNYATCVDIDPNCYSDYLVATDFDFAIPAGATINGITVEVNRQSTGFQAPFLRDNVVQLTKNGTALVGSNKAVTGTDWPTASPPTTATYGGAADLWGTTFTPAELNSTSFGVFLQARNASTFADRTASVDYIRVTVTYTPAVSNTAPTITSNGGGSTAAVSVAENGTAVTTVTATDPNAGQTIAYSITGGADAGKFTINSTTGALSFLAAPDYENPTDAGGNNVYDVIVQAADNFAPPGTDTQTIAVTVTNVNEAPIITSGGGEATASVSMPENTTFATDVNSTDPDGDSRTYSIIGGADASLFSITSYEGYLNFLVAPNFEAPSDSNTNNVYEVIVQVTDSGTPPLSDTQTISVTVTDVNEAPSIQGGDTASYNVPENTTAVANLSSTDPDAGQTRTYSITGGADQAKFSIVAADGTLSFLAAPDFEVPTDANTDNVYQVVVTVTDNGTPALSDSQTVSVTVTDVVENVAPVLSDVPAAASIPEMVAYTFDAGATDADVPAQTLTFSLVGAPTGAAIDPATGVFTWTPTEAQGPGVYPFTVRVSDGVANTDAAITLTVTEANLAPTDLSLSNATVKENRPSGTEVGKFSATDPDVPAQTFTYSLVSGTGSSGNAYFTIVGNALKTAVSFNYEAGDTYSIRVKVTDSGNPALSYEKVLTITIENVNEPFTETDYFQLTYTAGTGGTIQGDATQTVRVGLDGTPVTAVPNDGYRFVQWSDGFNNATRTDIDVTADLAVEAEFEVIPGDRWTDISDAQWLALYGLTADQIDSVADGRADGSFGPNLPINRGQFAKMAVDAFGVEKLFPGAASFSDVIPSHLFFGWIEGGFAGGLLTGYTDDTYRPGNNITRQQAASILGRYLVAAELAASGHIQGTQGTYPTLAAWFAAEGQAVLAPFTDAAKLATVHAPYTAYLIYHQVIMGSNSMLNPLANLTRAQAAAMVYRAAN